MFGNGTQRQHPHTGWVVLWPVKAAVAPQVVYDASEATVSELVKAVADCGFEAELLHKAAASPLEPDEVLVDPQTLPLSRAELPEAAASQQEPDEGPPVVL